MIYLVLYDSRGQCLYVASANDGQSVLRYLQAGFVQVDRSEYERCGALVDEATLRDLPRIVQSQELVRTIGTRPAQAIGFREPDLVALERLRSAQETKYQTITQQRIRGDINPDQWYRQMLNAITSGNIAATALAKGGLQNLNSEDRQRIEQDNQIQLDYLNRFRRDFDNISPAMALSRSKLYSGAVTSRYWTAHTRAMGLPLLPAMPGVRTSCGSNCRCNWNIIQLPGQGNWDCQWRVAAVEHCEECLMRQRTFDPLQIRNYVVQPFNPNGIYR